jgi:hypothetical protein
MFLVISSVNILHISILLNMGILNQLASTFYLLGSMGLIHDPFINTSSHPPSDYLL